MITMGVGSFIGVFLYRVINDWIGDRRREKKAIKDGSKPFAIDKTKRRVNGIEFPADGNVYIDVVCNQSCGYEETLKLLPNLHTGLRLCPLCSGLRTVESIYVDQYEIDLGPGPAC